MNIKTALRAYDQAEAYKRYHVNCRENLPREPGRSVGVLGMGRIGVAVDTDEHALYYQKYDRYSKRAWRSAHRYIDNMERELIRLREENRLLTNDLEYWVGDPGDDDDDGPWIPPSTRNDWMRDNDWMIEEEE